MCVSTSKSRGNKNSYILSQNQYIVLYSGNNRRSSLLLYLKNTSPDALCVSRLSRRESTVNSSARKTRSQGTSDAGTARTRRAGTEIVGNSGSWRRHQVRGLFQTKFPLAGSTVPISKLRRASPSNHSRSSVSMRAAEASLNSRHDTWAHVRFEYSQQSGE